VAMYAVKNVPSYNCHYHAYHHLGAQGFGTHGDQAAKRRPELRLGVEP
jgi:hypothetical protein